MKSLGLLLLLLLPAALPAQTPDALPPEQQALFDHARADFNHNDFKTAFTELQSLHTLAPDNALFTKFEAEAAINIGDYAAANSLLDGILAKTPTDQQALALLVNLYGQQHLAEKRDALLAQMQAWRDQNKISIDRVIVEKDPMPDGGTVQIDYFLQPWSRFHIVLMARFRDKDGKQTHRIALESDDIDQVQFAKNHPKEAAAGTRIYSTDAYSETYNADGKMIGQTHATLCAVPNCFITGRPTYEFFRTFILKPENAAPVHMNLPPTPPSSQKP